MDRWQYAKDEHPAYCTCVKCVDAKERGEAKRTRTARRAFGNLFERIISRLRRFFTRP